MEIARRVEFDVPGTPIPKGRPRVTKRGVAYTPKRTLDYEKCVKIAYLQMSDGVFFISDRVCLDITVYRKSAGKNGGDGDNYLKIIADALIGAAYYDDHQIYDWHAVVINPGHDPIMGRSGKMRHWQSGDPVTYDGVVHKPGMHIIVKEV